MMWITSSLITWILLGNYLLVDRNNKKEIKTIVK
jgi:hypothetical protein